MHSLRQKTYGIFILPYITYSGDVLVRRGNLYTKDPCNGSDIKVMDGQNWILYKGEYLTSFPLVRERVKEIMDELGYSRNDILVSEVIPIDHIVTPLT